MNKYLFIYLLLKRNQSWHWLQNSEQECRKNLKFLNAFQQGAFSNERITYWTLHERGQSHKDAHKMVPLAEFVLWLWAGVSLLLKCLVSQAGKGIFSALEALGTLFCTGSVCSRHLATCFLPSVFQLLLCASHTDFDFHLWSLPILFAGF